MKETTQEPDPLLQDLSGLPGLSPARQEQLRRLKLHTVRDILFYLPRAYEDLTDVRPIGKLSAGTLQTAVGEVIEIEGDRLTDGRCVVRVVLTDDGKNCLEGVWFNQPYAAQKFRFGQRLAFSGKPKWYRSHWQMTNPRVQDAEETASSAASCPEFASGNRSVIPVYPLTEDLRAEHLRPIIRRTLQQFGRRVIEILPQNLRQRRHLPEVHRALNDLHLPSTIEEAKNARRRFIYEEFLLLQLALVVRRRDLRDRQQAPRLPVTAAIDARIRRRLPFQLTADQNRAIVDICRDLASNRPMQRLLQADVGAGKTAVAVYAMLTAVANRHQAALMAPTEILARQHDRSLDRYLAGSRVRRLLLTGALSSRQRKDALSRIEASEVDLVVGTQALLQDDIRFARLGLVIIDEQHRFGVSQRAGARRLGLDPHYLVMTATPIPRTLALTVFGDLDVTEIKELPPGRQPVQTRTILPNQREVLFTHLRKEMEKGRQGYYVCPLIEESASLDVKSAVQMFEKLQAGPFRDFRLGLLHGRMSEADKDKVMEGFRELQFHMLVCTSVIEVGVDVPNATLLVVEQAERFGLSPLHQLRGRICRGPVAGECFLFAEPASREAKERLRLFVNCTDGFALAEQDARLRGGGELFGTRQHGLGDLRIGDLVEDRELLQAARSDAISLVKSDPGLKGPEYVALRQAVLERYGQSLKLAEVG